MRDGSAKKRILLKAKANIKSAILDDSPYIIDYGESWSSLIESIPHSGLQYLISGSLSLPATWIKNGEESPYALAEKEARWHVKNRVMLNESHIETLMKACLPKWRVYLETARSALRLIARYNFQINQAVNHIDQNQYLSVAKSINKAREILNIIPLRSAVDMARTSRYLSNVMLALINLDASEYVQTLLELSARINEEMICIDSEELPTFGGDSPTPSFRLLSWNETHVLLRGSDDDHERCILVDRRDYMKASEKTLDDWRDELEDACFG
jgi:hypothetical protein